MKILRIIFLVLAIVLFHLSWKTGHSFKFKSLVKDKNVQQVYELESKFMPHTINQEYKRFEDIHTDVIANSDYNE